MRIISKFKDYYDSAAAYGIDTSVVYVRETKELLPQKPPLPRQPVLFSYWQRGKHIQYEYRQGHLGFCGKVYPFVVVINDERGKQIFWDFESLDVFCNSIDPDWKYGYKQRYERWICKRFKEHYSEKSDTASIFQEHQVPIFCKWADKTLILNPQLKELEFYRVFNAYHAHQEIAMYVGGVLKQAENNTVEISNEDKIAKHGYDKHSFRADTGTKPNRKRK